MDCSRRDLLKWGAAAAAVWGAGASWSVAAERRRRSKVVASTKIPIALQLYSVRGDCEKDLPATLAAVAKMGYQGVEFAGYYGRTAEQLRKMLDDNGLRCAGSHIKLEALLGDELKKTVEFNRILGNRFLTVAYMGPDRLGTVEKAQATAKIFTDVAGKLKAERMRVGYHAHAHDFKKIGDRTPWDVFFTAAGPGVVMQLDVGNCLDGGGNPYEILKKFASRAATIHLKEHGGKHGAVIGEGDVDWKQVFQICESTGKTKWYIAEQEAYAGSPLDSVKKCLENLRKMGK